MFGQLKVASGILKARYVVSESAARRSRS